MSHLIPRSNNSPEKKKNRKSIQFSEVICTEYEAREDLCSVGWSTRVSVVTWLGLSGPVWACPSLSGPGGAWAGQEAGPEAGPGAGAGLG